MFIQTPQDIFYIVISIVVAMLGVLMAVAFVYIILFLKRGTDIAKQVRSDVARVGEIAGLVREKLMSPGVYVSGIIAAVLKGLNFINKNRKKKDE